MEQRTRGSSPEAVRRRRWWGREGLGDPHAPVGSRGTAEDGPRWPSHTRGGRSGWRRPCTPARQRFAARSSPSSAEATRLQLPRAKTTQEREPRGNRTTAVTYSLAFMAAAACRLGESRRRKGKGEGEVERAGELGLHLCTARRRAGERAQQRGATRRERSVAVGNRTRIQIYQGAAIPPQKYVLNPKFVHP